MDRDYSFLDSLDRGMYFDKKEYDGVPPLSYEEVKDNLPVPIVSSLSLIHIWKNMEKYYHFSGTRRSLRLFNR